jgi:hypothetical protein
MKGKKAMKRTTKKSLITLIVVMALAVVMFGVYQFNKPTPVKGSKTIEVTIDTNGEAEGGIEVRTINTVRKFLAEALLDEDIVAGDEGQYGLFVTEVLGVKADDSKQEWWCFTKNGGEQMNTSASEEPIVDGNKYEITLKVGW